MKKEIICTVCPIGCTIAVEGTKDSVSSIEGYACNRGKVYGEQEFLHPVRILTTTVKVEGYEDKLLPVRSDQSIPKELMKECMEVIKKVSVLSPVKCYDVVIPNICGCGANMIATGSIKYYNNEFS